MALILFSIFCLMCGWVPMLFNMGFMLMLTVGSIAPLSATRPFFDMAVCTILAAAYFGGIKLAAQGYARRRVTPAR